MTIKTRWWSWWKPLLQGALGLLLAGGLTHTAQAKTDPLELSIVYLEQQVERPPVLSNLAGVPDDEGLQGARLAVQDNNAAGRFFKQTTNLVEVIVPPEADSLAAFQTQLDAGQRFFVVNAPREPLLAMAEAAAATDAILFNAGAYDNSLRTTECRSNLFHTLPSHAMLTDALGQFMVFKKWQDWVLVTGKRPPDLQYAESLKRTAKRYGITIVEEKLWEFDADMRRSAQSEFPLFTQAEEDYDVLVVADETDDFGRYLPYHTWDPRPLVGTHGLKPVTWHKVVEQWGAAQLQSRFEKLAERTMRGKDYAVWVAVRSLGETLMRAKSSDPSVARAYLVGEEFKLAGFKGLKLDYRRFNGQLRQPIALVTEQALITQSPQEGFLHPVTALDSLGFDQPEVKCDF
jgi:ABC transporter substrate binding protein (PQQ-dependent alcohol dehydrogenase system)